MWWVWVAKTLYSYTDNLCRNERTKKSTWRLLKRKQMTYNEVKKTIGDVLESHRMLQTVKMVRPQEWLNRTSDALFPAAFYFINNGTINKGHDNDYSIVFWFLDKSGQEYKFESDVVSDMLGVATDIINLLNVGNNPYIIDESITYNVTTDQYEDYLAGVTFTLNLKTFSTFTACDAPTT